MSKLRDFTRRDGPTIIDLRQNSSREDVGVTLSGDAAEPLSGPKCGRKMAALPQKVNSNPLNYPKSRHGRSFGSHAIGSSSRRWSAEFHIGSVQKLNRALLLSTTLRITLCAVEVIRSGYLKSTDCQLAEDGVAIAYTQARSGRAWQRY